jgi:glycosyltransferase involved in cell wall biosynthesis
MKKDILISVYDMEIGGIERSLINMLEYMDYEKYNVDLLIFSHTGELMNLIPDKVNIYPQIRKFTVFRKPVVQCLMEGHFVTSIIRVICKILAMIVSKNKNLTEGPGYIQMQLTSKYLSNLMPKIRKKYDLAISYAWPHDFIANRVNADKKIAWIHTDFSMLEIDSKIDTHTWDKFNYIASISEECTNAFLTKYPAFLNKIILIENINSPKFIKEMANESISDDKNPNAFNIVSVGRLSYAKGFDNAIQALRKLHDKGLTNIKWNVIGFGAEEESLKKLIIENSLEDHFILLGKKNNPYKYMGMADLYVQPSRYEGKAVTVTEAKILGKPILITNYPTSISQLEPGIEGIICEASVEGLVKGIEELYQNTELRNTLINNLHEKDFSNYNELEKLYRMVEG